MIRGIFDKILNLWRLDIFNHNFRGNNEINPKKEKKKIFSKAFEEISQNKNLNYKIQTSYVYNAPTCCNSLGELEKPFEWMSMKEKESFCS